MPRIRTIIVGAAGRDFHNFNVAYRDDPAVEVVAFTAAQIPGIGGRRYPPSLSGRLYPEGIPIADEKELEALCKTWGVQQVVFAYSDVAHTDVMHVGSRALAAGADFVLLGPDRTMLRSKRPVIAVSAVRTGSGKSQTSRFLSRYLKDRGLRVAVLRHPMPYGDLASERVQRFATMDDLKAEHCTAEEREEYEPHLAFGNVVFAGVDYAAILAQAEAESDVVIWDGGNNDFPFLRPDLHIGIADALRPEQVMTHHPGEAVLRMADVVVVNKVDSAAAADVQLTADSVLKINPKATIVKAASPVQLADPAQVAGKRALIVEDGPTITHGGMPYGAGYVAALQNGVGAIVDPRDSATPEIRAIYEKYRHIGEVLPAVGYDDAQLEALRRTINASSADVVISASPIDLAALIALDKPVVRARYEYADAGEPTLTAQVDALLKRLAR
ncbi:MAG: cyclic 2,3-diphosphoglycerate synthase [Byssovorax sp.]